MNLKTELEAIEALNRSARQIAADSGRDRAAGLLINAAALILAESSDIYPLELYQRLTAAFLRVDVEDLTPATRFAS